LQCGAVAQPALLHRQLHDWPDPNSPLSAAVRKQFEPALDFLMSVRCFLHFAPVETTPLSWEATGRAPNSDRMYDSQGFGRDWMRIYFGQPARFIAPQPSCWTKSRRPGPRFRATFTTLRSRVSDPTFPCRWPGFPASVSALQDPEVLLRLFHFVAHHDVRLSTTTETRLKRVLHPWQPRRREERSCGCTWVKSWPNRMPPRRCAPMHSLRLAYAAPAGTESDRCPGGARLLSSLHRR